jgi:hypothetical protein
LRQITRSGVKASTTHSARRVQSPVERISASAGLAPSWLVAAATTSHTKGSSAAQNKMGLAGRMQQRLAPVALRAGRGAVSARGVQ